MIIEIISYSVPMTGKEVEEDSKKWKERREKYLTAKEIYNKAVIEVNNKNFQLAIDLFDQAEKDGFKDVTLYYNRGIAYIKSGKKELACTDWAEAARNGDEEAFKLYLKMCK